MLKICDFGLAEVIMKGESRVKRASDTAIPIRWMSLESIKERIFSVQSDVVGTFHFL